MKMFLTASAGADLLFIGQSRASVAVGLGHEGEAVRAASGDHH